MPFAVMVMVGGPDGTGVGVGEGDGVDTGGVGDVGGVAVAPPEHAATAIKTMKRQKVRSTASPTTPEGALRTRPAYSIPVSMS